MTEAACYFKLYSWAYYKTPFGLIRPSRLAEVLLGKHGLARNKVFIKEKT